MHMDGKTLILIAVAVYFLWWKPKHEAMQG
jgi:hypothetical protein